MNKPTLRFRAQLPLRRSYKPSWRPVLRVRPSRGRVIRLGDITLSRACAPEGAWPKPASSG